MSMWMKLGGWLVRPILLGRTRNCHYVGIFERVSRARVSCATAVTKHCKYGYGQTNKQSMTQWGRGVVTEVNSGSNMSINGFLHHILDIRPVNTIDEEEKPSDDEAPRRSLRERYPPVWTKDYIMNWSLDQGSVCLYSEGISPKYIRVQESRDADAMSLLKAQFSFSVQDMKRRRHRDSVEGFVVTSGCSSCQIENAIFLLLHWFKHE